MDFGQLLIPLLSGYLLPTLSNFFRYRFERLSGYHLLFWSAFTGVLLLVTALLVKSYVNSRLWNLDTYGSLPIFELAPVEHFLCAIASLMFILFGNVLCSKRRAAYVELIRSGSDIELLLADALNNHTMVELTTKSRKVYAGIVVECNLPTRKDSGVGIVPMLSGFRSSERLDVRYMINYAQIQQIAVKDEIVDDLDSSMKIVIPYDELISVRPFNPELYGLFEFANIEGSADKTDGQ